MDLLERLDELSRVFKIEYSILVDSLEEVIEKLILENEDIEIAEEHYRALQNTSFKKMAFDKLFHLRLDRLLQGKVDINRIVQFRADFPIGNEYRPMINNAILLAINSSNELYDATHEGGIVFCTKKYENLETYDENIYRDRMRSLCRLDFDSQISDEQILTILEKYLWFDKAGEVYIYGLEKFIDRCRQGYKSANSIEELIRVRVLFCKMERKIDEKIYRKLDKQMTGKYVGLCLRTKCDIRFEKKPLERLSILARLYADFGYFDTEIYKVKQIRSEIQRDFQDLSSAVFLFITKSKEARELEQILKEVQYTDLFDEKLVRQASSLDKQLSEKEINTVLGLSYEKMGEYLAENMEKNGELPKHIKSGVILNFYRDHLISTASKRIPYLITKVIESIPANLSSFYRRSLEKLADTLIDEIYVDYVNLASDIESTERAIANSKPDSKSRKDGLKKIETFIIEKIFAATSILDPNLIIRDEYNTSVVQEALAKKICELDSMI